MHTNANSLKDLCFRVIPTIKEAAAFIHQNYGKVKNEDIAIKDHNSLVSYVDKEAEKILVQGLHKLLPQATFLTEEETTEQHSGTWRWIIDPLDGTTNFLHSIPFFAISVALQHEAEIVIGIIEEVVRQETFYAWKGGGAWLNNTPISPRQNIAFSEALIATGFPYYDFDRMDYYFDILATLMQSTRGIRRIGSAALDLAYVACGRVDAFYEYSLHAWDVAAGACVVQEAGGVVSDFQGGDSYLFGKEIVAANQEVYAEMLKVVVGE